MKELQLGNIKLYIRAKGTTGRPHPQAMELAVPLMEEMIEGK